MFWQLATFIKGGRDFPHYFLIFSSKVDSGQYISGQQSQVVSPSCCYKERYFIFRDVSSSSELEYLLLEIGEIPSNSLNLGIGKPSFGTIVWFSNMLGKTIKSAHPLKENLVFEIFVF